jgi:hypothetical protein
MLSALLWTALPCVDLRVDTNADYRRLINANRLTLIAALWGIGAWWELTDRHPELQRVRGRSFLLGAVTGLSTFLLSDLAPVRRLLQRCFLWDMGKILLILLGWLVFLVVVVCDRSEGNLLNNWQVNSLGMNIFGVMTVFVFSLMVDWAYLFGISHKKP